MSEPAISPLDDEWTQYVRNLGLTLYRARVAAGLSQEQVAYRAGLAAFTYRKLEKGLSNPGTPANPRLRNLVALAQVLRVTVTDLLPADPPDVTTGQ